MPLSNTASFIPTINEFLAHWAQVDAALTPDLIVNAPDQTAMTRAGFVTLRDTLQTQFQSVINFLNDKEIARGTIRLEKAKILAHFNQFNALLDGYYAATPFINARAHAPSVTDGEQGFLAPMRDALSLWGKLNAAAAPAGVTLPLTLSDGTTFAQFQGEIISLQTAHANEASASQNAVLARSQRDLTMATVRATLVSYRKIVPARCAQLPALITSLPALSPAPGHTPDPVSASAVFLAPDQSKVVYAASAEATLARYELRGTPGDKYDDDDAITLATRSPADPREFITAFGLTQPGTEIALRVFVILTTGNEAGTPTMLVQRPG